MTLAVLSRLSVFIMVLCILTANALADGVYTRSVARGTVGGGSGSGTTGTGTANQVTFWNGTSTITGDTGLTYNSATDLLNATYVSASQNMTVTSWTTIGAAGTPSATLHIMGNNLSINNGILIGSTNGSANARWAIAPSGNNSIVERLMSANAVRTLQDSNGLEIFRVDTANTMTSSTYRFLAASISATLFTAVGSPTTPTCAGTTQGAMWINRTTGCLEYCNGGNVRQVTSQAASCS